MKKGVKRHVTTPKLKPTVGPPVLVLKFVEDVNAGAEAMDARIDNLMRSCVVQ